MGVPCADVFDLIAGTSTGAIVALGLAVPRTRSDEPRGYTAAELESVYTRNAARIFSRTALRRLVAIDDLLEERYPVAHLEQVLARYFGELRLSDLTVEALVPSFELSTRAPLMFERARARADEGHDLALAHVARATSAAPTYFEPFQTEYPVGTPRMFVDGGVVANNPAMCAFVRARQMWPDASRLILVSVGTGDLSDWIRHDEALGWGVAGWAKPLMEIVLDGGSELVDQQLEVLLHAQDYLRLQLPLTDASPRLDDASTENLSKLEEHADRVVEHFASRLEAIARELVVLTR